MFSDDLTLLFAVGAFNSAGNNKAEIIDLSGLNRTCPPVADYPVEYGSVGTFINDEALVCTGTTPSLLFNECYVYDQERNQWNIKVITNYYRSLGKLHSHNLKK